MTIHDYYADCDRRAREARRKLEAARHALAAGDPEASHAEVRRLEREYEIAANTGD